MRTVTFAAAALAAAVPFAGAQDAPAWPEIGSTAPDFTLPNLLDPDMADVSLSETLEDNDFAVIVWNSIECPYCVPYDSVLPGMAETASESNIAFLGINSNETESAEDIIAHLTAEGFNYPVLHDVGNVIADEYGATRTPEVYIVDSDMALIYHGRIDDSPRDRAAVENPDLQNALDALAAGNAIPVAETNAIGCTIKRVGDS